MALYLIDNATVTVNTVIIKFGRTLKISSLVNSSFIVQTNTATPSVVSNPFKAIDTLVDYNQISRTLTLYWKKILASNIPYTITLVNLLDSSGSLIPEETIKFTSSQASATPSYMQEPRGTIVNEVLISDKSVRVVPEPGQQLILFKVKSNTGEITALGSGPRDHPDPIVHPGPIDTVIYYLLG